ncbi:hypothetical protein Pla22_20320 [Rubripirellula amarantea]|uniref:Virus attachment protein p12 family protein n=1 Tax=Rubripirellula amarantea TaxID=2527999 RepID=A0A5C5WWR1_9BACT|nr:hypothetical protein [Rubripirellula amarantea]TWT54385.1 hypothetical protein Pla22_20320 [Rubripirellula amarantea]
MLSWQPIIATLIVLVAAAWLCRRIYRIVRSGSRDGAGHVSSCGTCSRNPQAADTKPVVSLGMKSPSSRTDPES